MGSRKIARTRPARGSNWNFAAVLTQATVSFFRETGPCKIQMSFFKIFSNLRRTLVKALKTPHASVFDESHGTTFCLSPMLVLLSHDHVLACLAMSGQALGPGPGLGPWALGPGPGPGPKICQGRAGTGKFLALGRPGPGPGPKARPMARPKARPFGSYVCHVRICGIKWDNI